MNTPVEPKLLYPRVRSGRSRRARRRQRLQLGLLIGVVASIVSGLALWFMYKHNL